MVRQTLDRIVAEPASFPRDVDPRLGLYHMFLKMIDDVGVDVASTSGADQSSTEVIANRRLSVIERRARTALLLTGLEDFSAEDAAYLLGVTRREVDKLVADALANLDEQTRTSVLIIEDEPIIAMDIETIVRSMGHDVAGIAINRREAVAAARAQRPGLILADIQLADDTSGVDAVLDITKFLDVPVIFITAYPERLLTAARPEPAFLITKPFQRSTVRAAISQALFFNEKSGVPSGSPPPAPLGRDSSGVSSAPVDLQRAAKALADVDVRPLAAPLEVELVGTQLRRAGRRKPRSKTSDAGTEALRRLHHGTAVRLCQSLNGTNLGTPFTVRLETTERSLAAPMDETRGLELGVQIQGLRTMLSAIRDQLAEPTAADLESFISDAGDLAWMFPSYRVFVAEAQSAGRLNPEGRAALIDLAKLIETQPDHDVDPEVKVALSAARINAQDGDDVIAEFGLRRAISNIWRAYAKFIQSRLAGINENLWKTFDKATGGTLGTILSVLLIIGPTLGILALAAPAEFAGVIALGKLVKLLVP